MNKAFLLLFFSTTLFFNQLTHAQSKMEKISHIQSEFIRINAIPDFKIVKLENEAFMEEMSDGGGALTGFFKKGDLLKITEWTGLSYGTVEIEYYFEKGQLIFSYVKEKYFQLYSDSIDRTTLTLKFEGRYYYKNDELIAQKNSGSGMWGNTLDNLNPILENSKKYSKLLLSGKK